MKISKEGTKNAKEGFVRNICYAVIVLVSFVLTACDERTDANKLSVSFETNGGSEVLPITVNDDGNINLPITIRSGYLFLGWYETLEMDGSALTAPYKPTEDITLYAKWTVDNPDIAQYIVGFVSNGGSDVAPIAVDCGQHICLPTPKKANYAFVGWFSNIDLDGDAVASQYKPTADTLLYAKWIEESPSVG